MQDVYRRLGEAETISIPMSLVTISFDPNRDTPQRLAAYAQNAMTYMGGIFSRVSPIA
jgi:cytochrome oxidase Cu insertion factor (SCO1/SenC/PrrC family)